MHAIEVTGLHKRSGSLPVLRGLTLQVREGEVFGLLGPNGAGKSTTIRMVLDIFRPDSGSIRVLGEEPWGGVKGRIGYLPEDRGLYRKMKVIEMLEFQGSIKGASQRPARKESTAWLERSIWDRARTPTTPPSGATVRRKVRTRSRARSALQRGARPTGRNTSSTASVAERVRN